MTPRVAFVNGGILGLLSYAKLAARTFADDARHPRRSISSSPTADAAGARSAGVLCASGCGPIRAAGATSTSRASAANTTPGCSARRRLLRAASSTSTYCHFHRQATAYASLDLMAQRPSIVSIDCTQRCAHAVDGERIERRALALQHPPRRPRILRAPPPSSRPREWAARDCAADVSRSAGARSTSCRNRSRSICRRRWIDERRTRNAAGRSASSSAATFRARGATTCSRPGRRDASPNVPT
jgi:hypothetical protein